MKRFLFLLLSLVLLCSTAFAASNGGEIVYITRTGECYHSGGCRYLSKSKIEITLADAVARGYRRCSRCNPPYLVEYTPTPTPRPTATPELRAVATPAPTWRAQDDITAAYQTARSAERRQTARPTATPERPESNKDRELTVQDKTLLSATVFIPASLLIYVLPIVWRYRRKK